MTSKMLRTKFATTIEEDLNILSTKDLEWRKYLAVTHRVN